MVWLACLAEHRDNVSCADKLCDVSLIKGLEPRWPHDQEINVEVLVVRCERRLVRPALFVHSPEERGYSHLTEATMAARI